MIHQLKFKPVTEASNNEPNTFYESALLQQYINDLTDSNPVEVTVSGQHTSWKDCSLLLPAGSNREVVFTGDLNDIPSLISSYRWMEEQHGSTWQWTQNANGNWVRETAWSGGQAQNLYKRNPIFVGRNYAEIQRLVNWESGSIYFEAPNKIKAQNLRLDNFDPGRKINVSGSNFNNKLFTVLNSTANEILVEEPVIVDENNTNLVKLMIDGPLQLGEYTFETNNPSTGRCKVTVYDLGDYTWGHSATIVAINQSNVTYENIDCVLGLTLVKGVNDIEFERCNFDLMYGKAISFDSTTETSIGVHVNKCNFRDVIEGVYQFSDTHSESHDILVSNCFFERINYTLPNKYPAADGHCFGSQNGSDHVAEYCVAKNIQGVAFAHYPRDGAPNTYYNCGYQNIYVDTVREFVQETGHSIEGINLSGDANITQVGGRFIRDCVVVGVNGEAVRFKATDLEAAQITGNIVLDSKTAFRNQKVLGDSSYKFYGNQTVGCDKNIHITNTLNVNNVEIDYNVYEDGKLFDYKRINTSFDDYKTDVQANTLPTNELNSLNLPDEGTVRNQALLRIKAIEAAIKD